MDETLLMPVHVKIFIALKIWAAFKARMLQIPTNNTRAVELCSRLHVCCVLSVREHGNAKRRDLLSFFILCLCRCGWSYHHQHPDKPQQWTEAGYCLCLSEENQKGSKIRRNNSYLIFFLWVVRFSGLVHLTINCEQMRSYYWAYCFTGSKDAFTLFESVEDFLAVAEITMVTYEPASHQAREWKANLRECLYLKAEVERLGSIVTYLFIAWQLCIRKTFCSHG